MRPMPIAGCAMSRVKTTAMSVFSSKYAIFQNGFSNSAYSGGDVLVVWWSKRVKGFGDLQFRGRWSRQGSDTMEPILQSVCKVHIT